MEYLQAVQALAFEKYDSLLELEEFRIRFHNKRFRKHFDDWCERTPNYVLCLFCNPGFCVCVHRITSALVSLHALFFTRCFYQAWGYICDLVSNSEFCDMMDKPIFMDAIKDLNERYPIDDLVKMFRTPGFCTNIVSPSFRVAFRKFEYKMGNIASPISNPWFVSRLLCHEFVQYTDWLCQVFGRSNTTRMLSCPEFCEFMETKERIHDVVAMFGICETAKLFSSTQFYANRHFDPRVLVLKFGKVGASKLLRKSHYLQHVDHIIYILGSSCLAQQVLCTKWFIMNTDAIQTLVGWVGSKCATSLLLQEFFVLRMSDHGFLKHLRLLLDACGSAQHICNIMKCVCLHIAESDFVTKLCALLQSVGPEIVLLVVQSPHFSELGLGYVCEFAKSLTYSESVLILGSTVLRDRLLAQFCSP